MSHRSLVGCGLLLLLSLALCPAQALTAEPVSKSNFTDCPYNASDLKLWSESDTWRIPVANASEAAKNGSLTDVIILGNFSQVLLDVSRVSAGGLIIENGSSLILDDRDYVLTFGYIRILPGGALIGGSDTCPLTSAINITLVGTRSQDPDSAGFDPADGDSFGSKAVAVASNASLHLFGVAPATAWTRLAATAHPGDSSVLLLDAVNWTVGATVLLAGSAYHSDLTGASAHEHEEVVIDSISMVQRAVDGADRNVTELTFRTPLRFRHLGEGHTRSEAAVLSRNVLIAGDALEPTRFGFHLIVRKAASLRLSGVEFVRGGQLGVLGRYPVHFHLSGDLSGTDSFVRACSFRQSLQRALTLHGASGVDVADNVAYDAIGHMFLLEDGSEDRNTLRHNLGVLARPMLRNASSPPGLLDGIPGTIFPLRATDDQPAIFQVLSPANEFVDNAAVGGTHGFWLTFPIRPSGPSFWAYMNDTSKCPRYQALGAFEGNTAHGAVRNGLFLGQHSRLSQEIEQGVRYSPRQGPYPYRPGSFPPTFAVDELEPLIATLRGVTTWANGAYGAMLEAEHVTLEDFVSVGNRFGFGLSPFNTAIVNSLVVGSVPSLSSSLAAALQGSRSLNISSGLGRTLRQPDALVQAGVVLFPGLGAQWLHNITFANFSGADTAAIAVSEQLVPSRAFIAADSLSFVKVESRFLLPRYPSAARYDVGSSTALLDLDGAIDSFSLNGSAARARPSWIVSNDTAALSPLRANHSACRQALDSATSLHAVCDALQVPSVVSLQLTNLFPEGTDYSLGLLETIDSPLTAYPFSRTGNLSSTPGVALRGVDLLERPNGTRTVFRVDAWTHSGVMLRFYTPHATPPAFALSLSGAAPGDWVVVGIPIVGNHLDPCTAFRVSSPAGGVFACHHGLKGLAASHTIAYDADHSTLFVRVDQTADDQHLLRAANASLAYYNDSSADNVVTVIDMEGLGREMADDVKESDWLPTASMLAAAIPERFFEASLNETVNSSADSNTTGHNLLVRAAFAYDLVADALSFVVYHNAGEAAVSIASLALRVGNSSESILLLSNDTALSATPIRNYRLRLSEDLPLNSSDSNRTELSRGLEAAALLEGAELVVALANTSANSNSTLATPLLLLPNTTAPPMPTPVTTPPSATGTAGPGPISSTGTAQTPPSATGPGESSSSASASASASATAPTPSASASATATGSGPQESSSPSATGSESSSVSATGSESSSLSATGSESSSGPVTGSESSSVSSTGTSESSVSATGTESSSVSASASASVSASASASTAATGLPTALPTALPTSVPTAVPLSGLPPSASATGTAPPSPGTSRRARSASALWKRWREAVGA